MVSSRVCFPRCAAFILAALSAAPPAAHELTDDRGVSVTWSARPGRIVALSPHLVEIAYAAGAGAQLAAVVRFSDYPPEAARLPRVGDAARIDLERVLAIRPDLVLGWRSGNPPVDLQRLERRGFRVFVTEPRRLTDIGRVLRLVGTLAHTREVAEAAAARFEGELDMLRTQYAGRTPVRVFYEIWHRPLLTVNGTHVISDAIALCGGVNVFSDVPVLTPSVSLEAVLQARPQIILGGSSAMEEEDFASEWRRARSTAFREIPVRFVPPDLIQRQTPRLAQGARRICEHIDEARRLPYGLGSRRSEQRETFHGFPP
jgi:iron complex transport system substrate-binding protein